MPTNANEDLLDATIRHQIQLLRYSKGQAKSAAALLEAADAELVALIGSGLTEVSEARLKALLVEIRRTRAAAIEKVGEAIKKDTLELAGNEAEWELEAIKSSVPAELSLTAVSPATLKALTGKPINGVPLDGWLGTMASGDISRIEQQLRLGVVQGETLDQLVRRIRGTKANNYVDGVTAITRRNAETIARTSVNHISNAARQEVWNANSDIINGVRWVATLDGRTSPVCRGRDGHVYPIDAGPRPPAHPGCRSTTTPVLAGERIVGDRPFVRDTRTRQVRETDFRTEAKNAAGEKWKGMTPGERNEAIKSQRSKWAAENIGQAPSSLNYNDWLKRQPKAFQDEVLGKAKADIFRSGVPLDKFVDEKGKSYTIDQLKASTTGDKLFVQQPGVGMKAKALLQSGLSGEQVLAAIKAEYPEASTSLASIASYKTELKKAGALDLPVINTPNNALKKAQSVADVVAHVDANLPAGMKHALGGQWANVVDDLDGGAYGYYQAGKGVTLSGKKLSAISQGQAQQVTAHELGHLLHKQHDLMLPSADLSMLKTSAAGLSTDSKKLYGYYLASTDELVAEVYAQALSPSVLTSQGLSALEFNKAFGGTIEAAKKAMAEKFPVPPVGIKPPLPGGPAVAFEVAGKHTTVGSLAKALLQQGLPDDQVLKSVLAEFPNAKTSKASLASYKVELKKAGLLPGQVPGVVVPVKAIPGVAPVPSSPEAVVLGKAKPAVVSVTEVTLQQLKFHTLKLLDEEYMLGAADLQATLAAQFPANKISLATATDLKNKWIQAGGPKVKKALAAEKAAVKVAADSGPLVKPALYGKPLGQVSSSALNNLKTYFAAGGDMPGAHAMLGKVFTNYAESKGADLIELAKYELATGKSVAKPYLSAAYQPAKPQVKKPMIDLTPTRPAVTPRDGLPPPPRFSSEQRRAAIEKWAGTVDTRTLAKMNQAQKDAGLELLLPEESAAIRSYTGNTYHELNSALRGGAYTSDNTLQAYVEAAQHGLRKMPKYTGMTARGMTVSGPTLERILAAYKPGAIVEEHAFISTSTGDHAAFSGNMFIKIKSKTGVLIQDFSKYSSKREVLYMPGTRLRVLSVEQTNGKYVVNMEEV